PEELIEFNTENPAQPNTVVLQSAAQTGLKTFLGMMVARDGTLWISGPRGLEHSTGPARNLKAGESWREYLAPAVLSAENLQLPLEDIDGNGVTCAADSASGDEWFVVHFDGQNWTCQMTGTQRIRGAWRGAEGTTWVVNLNRV